MNEMNDGQIIYQFYIVFNGILSQQDDMVGAETLSQN